MVIKSTQTRIFESFASGLVAGGCGALTIGGFAAWGVVNIAAWPAGLFTGTAVLISHISKPIFDDFFKNALNLATGFRIATSLMLAASLTTCFVPFSIPVAVLISTTTLGANVLLKHCTGFDVPNVVSA